MCWSSGMGSSLTRLALCPSRSLNLVYKIPILLFSLSETNTIGYYRTALRLLGKTSFERRMTVDLSTEQAWEKKGGRRSTSRYHDDPELRYALEDTLRTQHVR